jgi:CubicO group peptidase (beta-lactamase class C family)
MKKIASIVFLNVVLFSAHAQSGTKPTPEELSRFFDRMVPALMETHHAVGVVVGVTDSSETLFLGGYGSADLEKGIPVDPQNTLFRAGSISKLFTWTAIMQLEEQGRLDLDDPVEKYLDFDLPDTFDEPIRIIDLMNHTPGFEDRLIGLFVQDEQLKQTLEESVKQDIPRRVRRPGTEVSYSNYGTMLAGYIVERISGMSYEQYVERRILDPLGMERSTFRQPPPPQLAEHLAAGYSYRGGEFIREGFEIVNGAPAGALSTTAEDILRFYRAYLNDGRLGDARILKEDTVKSMRQPTFRHDPRASGTAHGFFESGYGELRGYGHGGDTMFFHSDSAYLPNEDLAYFISTNTATGMLLVLELLEMLVDEFYPVPTGNELAAKEGPEADLQEYTGFFAMNRRAETDPTQILGGVTLINPRVSEDGNGLWIASMLEPEGSLYVPVARDIFQQADGQMRIIFLRDDRGRIQSAYANEIPAFLFSRPPWIEQPLVSLIILSLGMLFLLTGLIAPPVGLLTLIPRLRSKAVGAGKRIRLSALWSARGYLALVGVELAIIASLGNLIFVPIGPVHAIPLYLAAAVVVLVLISAVLAWPNKLFRTIGRLHYSAFALSQALFMAWLGYWGFFFV